MNSTSGTGQLLDELQALIRSAQMLLEAAGSNEPRARAPEPEHDGVEDALGVAAEQLHAAQEELIEQARRVRAGGERYLREHPLTALGVAAALGFLVGMALARRRGPDERTPKRGD